MIDHVSEYRVPPSVEPDHGQSVRRLVEDVGHQGNESIVEERPARPKANQAGERLLRIEALNERLLERAASRRAAILRALVA